MKTYLKNNDFVLGLGIGIVIATLLMLTYSYNNIPKYKIEKMARDLGMLYPDEIKSYFEKK